MLLIFNDIWNYTWTMPGLGWTGAAGAGRLFLPCPHISSNLICLPPWIYKKIIYMPFNDKYIQLTTLNCLALALSSCCSTASACWVLWISKVAPMGWLDVGGGEEWSQLVRLEQIEPKQLGKRTEDNVVQYTEAPMHMYNTELMRLLVELAISWRPNT